MTRPIIITPSNPLPSLFALKRQEQTEHLLEQEKARALLVNSREAERGMVRILLSGGAYPTSLPDHETILIKKRGMRSSIVDANVAWDEELLSNRKASKSPGNAPVLNKP